eukprot:761797-Hanusia_phi.AAC.3
MTVTYSRNRNCHNASMPCKRLQRPKMEAAAAGAGGDQGDGEDRETAGRGGGYHLGSAAQATEGFDWSVG